MLISEVKKTHTDIVLVLLLPCKYFNNLELTFFTSNFANVQVCEIGYQLLGSFLFPGFESIFTTTHAHASGNTAKVVDVLNILQMASIIPLHSNQFSTSIQVDLFVSMPI